MNQLRCIDNMEGLRDLGDNSIDSIVTDPPYGISFLGKRWDYDVPSVELWAECLRVLKPGGHLLAFAGTRTQHRMATRIEDGGFEIREMIAWVHGQGFPKSHNGPWGGTALKPSLEPITVARKPLIGTVAENVCQYGTGGLNIDGCRVGVRDSNESGWSKTGSRASENRAMSGANYDRDPKPEIGLGRWPANLIHDGSDEVVGLFPVTAPSKAGGRSTGRNFGQSPESSFAKDRERTGHDDNGGSTARFFYCAKASKKDRGEDNKHPTVKPVDLMRYLCRLVTPKDGIVLDPFAGSGSTLVAAMLEGFRYVGFELDPEYAATAVRRIAAHKGHETRASKPAKPKSPKAPQGGAMQLQLQFQ